MAAQAATPVSAATACANLLTEAIPVKWVERMLEQGKASDPQTQRLRDIVQRLGFNNAALNQQLIKEHNDRYTVQLEQGTPTDQQQSGRCWIFAGLNMIRSGLIAEGKVPANFEFSENYLHFFNMLEKSNSYLEDVIGKTYKAGEGTKLSTSELNNAFEPQLGDGGWYNYFMLLVSKYGLVPKDVMPETKSSQSTSTLTAELKRQLAEVAKEILHEARTVSKEPGEIKEADYLARVRAIKERGMAGIWRILATHLGDPPSQFDYRTDARPQKDGTAKIAASRSARFSPVEFAKSFAGFNAADYVVVSASPRRGPGLYEQEDSAIGAAEPGKQEYNVRFLNVSVDRLMGLAATSIRGGQPVWFAADVSKDVDHASGIMHPDIYVRDPIYNLPKNEKMDELSRVGASFFGVTGPNHAMLLTGYDQPDPNGPIVKFRDENSWGEKVGTKGTYHLYAEWFRENVFQIVVNKKFLSEQELKTWNGTPTVLKENDELF